MRRTLVIFGGIAGSVGLLVAAPWQARALVAPTLVTHTATCAVTSYTLTGSFQRLSGQATFSIHANGGCVGTSSSVNVDLSFTSVGSWSCAGGVAQGSGAFAPNNGANQVVSATLANVGGEYVVELHNPRQWRPGSSPPCRSRATPARRRRPSAVRGH